MNNNLKNRGKCVTVQRSNKSLFRQMIRTADTAVTEHVEVLLARRRQLWEMEMYTNKTIGGRREKLT
jgi:hypothetical protein